MMGQAIRWMLETADFMRSRRKLAELDDRCIADIGLTRVEARYEAARPFWDRSGAGLPIRPRPDIGGSIQVREHPSC
jgi:uncharacterized protein YjiS (DUF1127 family)